MTAQRNRTGSSRPPTPRGGGRSRLLAGVLAAGALAATLGACSSGPDATSGSEEGGSDREAELAHVHGLGVNPEDGALMAGSHFGLYRVPADGDPELVSEVQDFMGFTVVGPDHFLSSGHPGEGQDGPGAVGLIESEDGGRTWETVSLAGEADFHALDARGDRVYGINAMDGSLMVSDDGGATWQTRSAPPMADVSISPDDVDTLVATTQEGPALSTDAGETFTPFRDAPFVLLLDWAPDGALVGVDSEGVVHRSTDDGATWEKRGELGAQPEALDASSAEEVYAAAGGDVLVSTDGGATFEARYQGR